MSINVDSHYVIGQSHLNNEDYAISNVAPFPHMILADGCSSSAHSDIGARMLVMAAREYLLNDARTSSPTNPEHLAVFAALKAEAATRVVGAPTTSIDATLAVAFIRDDNAYVYLFGDGSVFVRKTTGEEQLVTVDYSHNAPYYPSYRADSARDAEYKARSGNAVKVVTVQGERKQEPLLSPTVFTFPVERLSLLMITSDGLSSFIDTQSARSIEASTITSELTRMRNTNGAFMKRKLKRALKTWSRDGIHNSDDLSVGAMVFTPPM